MAWKLVLSGRFRLLNQWCIFVEVLLLIKTQLFSVDLIVYLDRTRNKNNSLYLGKVVAVFFVCGITSIMVVIYIQHQNLSLNRKSFFGLNISGRLFTFNVSSLYA